MTAEQLRALIEAYLEELALSPQLGTLAEPMRHALGGKRVRPVLCLATGDAIGARVESLLPAAAAVELVHSFSLVHDDLPALDDDAERRGAPSVWAQYDEATAVLAGDALLAEAFRLALSYGTSAVARELVEATLAMIGGQWLDVRGGAPLDELHRLKTGALFTASIGCALAAAEVPRAEQEPWREFAAELGLALPDRRRHPRRRRLRGRRRRGGRTPPRRRGRGARSDAAGRDRRRHVVAVRDRRRARFADGVKLQGRLGALAERNFRLVFSSTTISALGDGVTTVALAFAVLGITDSPTALGLVIAAKQASAAAITVAAGVWADRLPRHLVLVAAALVQGAVQAVAGTLLITGHATVWMLIVLALVFGLADGFVIPTSQGLIPLVVSAVRLQQANALLGLSRSILGVLGPALGGVLVGAGSPGGALLVDAASFGAGAILMLRVRIPKRDDSVEPEPFLAELREGWNEFRRQTWIWTTIVFFGIGNCASTSRVRARPTRREGALLGRPHLGDRDQRVRCRHDPRRASPRCAYGRARPLLVSCVAAVPIALQPFGWAFELPVTVLVAIGVVAGIGIAIHLALWFTIFQRNVPEAALSRVSSYDALGSFVLMPLGAASPARSRPLIGVKETLIVTGVIELVCFAIIIAQPSVWAITRLSSAEPVAA